MKRCAWLVVCPIIDLDFLISILETIFKSGSTEMLRVFPLQIIRELHIPVHFWSCGMYVSFVTLIIHIRHRIHMSFLLAGFHFPLFVIGEPRKMAIKLGHYLSNFINSDLATLLIQIEGKIGLHILLYSDGWT